MILQEKLPRKEAGQHKKLEAYPGRRPILADGLTRQKAASGKGAHHAEEVSQTEGELQASFLAGSVYDILLP